MATISKHIDCSAMVESLHAMESIHFQQWWREQSEEYAKVRLELYETDDGLFIVELFTDPADESENYHTISRDVFGDESLARKHFRQIEVGVDLLMNLTVI